VKDEKLLLFEENIEETVILVTSKYIFSFGGKNKEGKINNKTKLLKRKQIQQGKFFFY
jgi:hypothetical protein